MIKTIILFLIIFGIVVISHEFGHFLIGKRNGIRVVEFAVGMGPTLFSFRKGETKYSLKLLPIGGACMFDGEDGVMAENGEADEHSFLKANVSGSQPDFSDESGRNAGNPHKKRRGNAGCYNCPAL